MAKQSKDILEQEALFQDLKIEKKKRKDQGRFYEDKAAQHMFAFRAKQIGSLKGKKILDLGCGKGESTISSLEAGAYVTAIDISPLSIEYVKEQAREKGLEDRLCAEVMDANNLTIEDNTFDMVIGGGILHHLPTLEKALSEIRRVLKPGGYAVFHEPLGINPFINLYRFCTPSMRTKDEEPLKTKELELIKKVFPKTDFTFFDNLTLLSKIFSAAHLPSVANGLQGVLIPLDEKLLKSKKSKITFAQKMAWVVVMKMYK